MQHATLTLMWVRSLVAATWQQSFSWPYTVPSQVMQPADCTHRGACKETPRRLRPLVHTQIQNTHVYTHAHTHCVCHKLQCKFAVVIVMTPCGSPALAVNATSRQMPQAACQGNTPQLVCCRNCNTGVACASLLSTHMYNKNNNAST